MEVWRTETCYVVNSPVGTDSQSLPGFFNGKMYHTERNMLFNRINRKSVIETYHNKILEGKEVVND